jgi:UTP--glucose-1-phosphate uridylyltransferase
MSRKVTKAVIPAAGLGNRMWPLTKGAPKEMLPVAGRPMIHHVVQEAVDAGIEEICIVIRDGKESIPRYFEEREPDNGADEATWAAEKLRSRCEIMFVYQAEPRGLGDALLCARQFVDAECFAMLIPDQLFIGEVAPVAQLTNKKLPVNSVISSLIRIPDPAVAYFPGARRFVYESDTAQSDVVVITGIEPDELCCSTGHVRGFGRTIYPPEVFGFLGRDFADPRTGEVNLLKTFQALLKEIPNYGVFLDGEAFDLGTIAGYQYFGPKWP